MAAAVHVHCWGCGALQPERERFQCCALCRSELLDECFFCTAECLLHAWPRHKEWHREQRRLHALAAELSEEHWRCGSCESGGTRARRAASSAYDELLSAAASIALSSAAPSDAPSDAPSNAPSDAPTPTSATNFTGTDSTDSAHAKRAYLRLVERAPRGSLVWAEVMIGAYALLSDDQSLPRPRWWEDRALRSLADEIVALRPDHSAAWRLRGEVFCGVLGASSWGAGARPVDDLREAARSLQRAIELIDDAHAPEREASSHTSSHTSLIPILPAHPSRPSLSHAPHDPICLFFFVSMCIIVYLGIPIYIHRRILLLDLQAVIRQAVACLRAAHQLPTQQPHDPRADPRGVSAVFPPPDGHAWELQLRPRS